MTIAQTVLAILAVFCSLTAVSRAETYRCGNGVVVDGDAKADVLQRCGPPQSQETFCEPVRATPRIDATGATVYGPPLCETVDSWTYDPGSGSFITVLEFKRGKLTTITTGSRSH